MTNMLDILKQPSSWRGIVMLLGALGIATDVATVEQIVMGAMGLAGLIGLTTDDRKLK